MAQREYRELRCRDTGTDCDFFVRAETADEVISFISEHDCRVHNICQITPETKDQINSLMKSVWCGGEFIDIQEAGTITPQKEWMEN